MWFKAVTCLLSLIALGEAAAKTRLAARAEDVTIYAYGPDIAGYQVYSASDGNLFHTFHIKLRPRPPLPL